MSEAVLLIGTKKGLWIGRSDATRWYSGQASAIQRGGRQFFSHATADQVLLGTGTPVVAWERGAV